MEVPIGAAPGVAVGAGGTFYAGSEGYSGSESHVDVIAKERFEEESTTALEPVIEALDPENTTGLAVDESSSDADPSQGDVYLDEGDAIRRSTRPGRRCSGSAKAGAKAKGALEKGAGVAVDGRPIPCTRRMPKLAE